MQTRNQTNNRRALGTLNINEIKPSKNVKKKSFEKRPKANQQIDNEPAQTSKASTKQTSTFLASPPAAAAPTATNQNDDHRSTVRYSLGGSGQLDSALSLPISPIQGRENFQEKSVEFSDFDVMPHLESFAVGHESEAISEAISKANMKPDQKVTIDDEIYLEKASVSPLVKENIPDYFGLISAYKNYVPPSLTAPVKPSAPAVSVAEDYDSLEDDGVSIDSFDFLLAPGQVERRESNRQKDTKRMIPVKKRATRRKKN